MKHMYTKILNTPLGSMLAIADDDFLYFLEFTDTRGFEKQIKKLESETESTCVSGVSKPIESIEKELDAFFSGNLKTFNTALLFKGTPFQQKVWNVLANIPFGQTISYTELAERTGNGSACRAVANANAVNRFAIVIPCHRVVRKNGDLGGYAGGISKKEWLLQYEQTVLAQNPH